MNNSLTIFGSGSSLPTKNNFPTAQILELRDKQFMIDCGEGAQIRMRQIHFKTNRLGHIFISHLHGDHCFGLIGLISSFGMLGRTADLHIHAQPDLQKILQPQLDYFCDKMTFEVIFHNFNPNNNEIIYEDRTVKVSTIPLKHRVPCCGFLFEEKPKDRHIIREMIDFYEIPFSQIHKIKKGEDFVTSEGKIISNERLTTAPEHPIRFAYCSDTSYSEKIIPIIKGVDCLYHEATFEEEFAQRAKETKHSTATQAATIALKAEVKQLIIGHFSARHSNQSQLLREAQSVFPNTLLAKDLNTYPLSI